MTENEIGTKVLDAAVKVHRVLGPGLLESAYQECLLYELRKDGMRVQKEWPLPLVYEGVNMEIGYRVDLFVEHRVIIEVKALEYVLDVHLAQVITYLRLSNCKLGYLLNFNVPMMKQGIKRVVNGL